MVVSLGPSLGILEVQSIARGYFVLDAMTKRAPVTVLRAEPVSPGKYWIAISGGEAEVAESMVAGIDVAGSSHIDHTLLAYAHNVIFQALSEDVQCSTPRDAIGVLEAGTLASIIRAADSALKCTNVALVDLHLARGIGGKGYLVITGTLSDVEAAIEAAVGAAGETQCLGREILANPDSAVSDVSVARRKNSTH
jgi:microcompartment protein CcmL/EutN